MKLGGYLVYSCLSIYQFKKILGGIHIYIYGPVLEPVCLQAPLRQPLFQVFWQVVEVGSISVGRLILKKAEVVCVKHKLSLFFMLQVCSNAMKGTHTRLWLMVFQLLWLIINTDVKVNKENFISNDKVAILYKPYYCAVLLYTQ